MANNYEMSIFTLSLSFMRAFFITLLFVGLLSCKRQSTSNWKTIDLAIFTIEVPKEWKIVETRDNFSGRITNGVDTLYYNYGKGFVSDSVGLWQSQLIAIDTVNGLPATIIIPASAGGGHVGMDFYHLTNSTIGKFNISGDNIQNTDTILKIFKTLCFGESNPDKNPPLSKNKFKAPPISSREQDGIGERLVMTNCISCHYINNDMILVGPPLRHISSRHSFEWVSTFLTNPALLKKDPVYISIIRKYKGIDHPIFRSMSKEDLQNMYIFLDKKPTLQFIRGIP
jgi:hypothetical protein